MSDPYSDWDRIIDEEETPVCVDGILDLDDSEARIQDEEIDLAYEEYLNARLEE